MHSGKSGGSTQRLDDRAFVRGPGMVLPAMQKTYYCAGVETCSCTMSHFPP